MNENFTHLHLHTEYSLLDGYGSPKSRVLKAKELGMTAMAITDHNIVAGCADFQQACKEEDIKPLLGGELYYTEDMDMLSKTSDERLDIATETAIKNGIVIPLKATKKKIKELISDYLYDTKQYHMLFIAKNQTGWNNLVQLQAESSEKCTYNGRFLCDDNLLDKYKEGLIVTTACIGSIVNKYFMNGEDRKAYSKLDKWREMFKENFYIEIQPLNDSKQALCNLNLINYALDKNVKIVATNDVHYNNENDWDDHDTLVRIGIGKKKYEISGMEYKHEFWVRSYDEMITAFTNQYNDNEILNSNCSLDEYLSIIREALENTNSIADEVKDNIKLKSDTPVLPELDIPNNLLSSQYLSLLSVRKLWEYFKKNKIANTKEYTDRLKFELNVINTKGYADYILIVKELTDWCKKEGIPVGPGRGSAAGSLILFLIGITKGIDPIKYGLLFSRFLTMDRTSLPDIDMDFSYLNRLKVIAHLEEKYGADCVSYIGTFTKLGVKNGLKDVGRVLGIDFKVMNDITKKIDEITDKDPEITFAKIDNLKNGNAIDIIKYEVFEEMENANKELFRLARAFENSIRNMGVHASGILVTPFPVKNLFPVRISNEGSLVTLYDGNGVERCGGVKFDILGLRTLDVLDLAVKSYDENMTVYDLYDKVQDYMANEKMFELLNRRETEGIFQLGSGLFKGLIKDILPTNIEDISVITSLARPGPLKAKMHIEYAERKRNKTKGLKEEPLPNTWDLVEDSEGVICYQEQCMMIAQRVAGFDDNQADSFLRKAMA